MCGLRVGAALPSLVCVREGDHGMCVVAETNQCNGSLPLTVSEMTISEDSGVRVLQVLQLHSMYWRREELFRHRMVAKGQLD